MLIVVNHLKNSVKLGLTVGMYTVSQKMTQLWNSIARNYMDWFWWYLAAIFKRLTFFSFHVGLLVITLSSLKLHTENTACMLCASVSCWAHLLLQHLRHRSLRIIRETDDRWIPSLVWNFSDSSVVLSSWVKIATQLCRRFISMCTASAAARTPFDCSELHQQPVDAVLRPTFVKKLCYKLPSTVTFTFMQTSKFCLLYWIASKLAHLLDSKFALFSVSGLKDELLIKTNVHEKWNMQTQFKSLQVGYGNLTENERKEMGERSFREKCVTSLL